MDYVKAGITVLLIANLAGMYNLSTQQPEINIESPEAPQVHTNYTPPEQGINYTPPDQDITVKSSKANYIQANNHEVDYGFNEENLVVEDIDLTGKIYGTSMRPTMFSGHTMLLENYNNQELEEGDIIRFNTQSGAVAHRIEGDYSFREEGYYLTRGDNNDGREKISPENITHIVKGVLYTE